MPPSDKSLILAPVNSLLRSVVILCGMLLFAALAPLQCLAQTQTPQQTQRPRRVVELPDEESEPEEILRIDTDLVLVDVTVTDSGGRLVRNLRPEDFKLYEDGVERPISFFNIEKRGGTSRPFAVVFALDISGSMTLEEMERLRGAVRIFSKRLAEYPSVFAVIAFGMNVKVLQTFTGDPQKLDHAFDKLAREPNGLSTHTYDAVDDAIRLLVRKAPRTRERRLMKRAVVVVTDGFPVGDTVSPQTVIERANAADVSVYTVTLPSYSRMLVSTDRTPLPTPLDVSGLAEKTGGTNIYAFEKDFEPLFRALAEEVTSTYVLAFYPTEEKRRDGRFHTVRIEAPRGLTVRQSRPGYQGGKQ
ncbi:MAG TPA: VWA domain-containing protein [Pyrinomonadaceae bacterium]|nr:VWA domain-containing protein [Pyrinomonadaceae bacterium]